MYQPGILYQRSVDERRNMFKAWQRSDKAFFASGACHILAHMFISLHPGEDFELIYLRPNNDLPGCHLYASDGTWAFDFNGWTHEKELLQVTTQAYEAAYPGWKFDRIVIKEGLVEYLKHTDHLRPPEYFPELPWKRAYDFIHMFPARIPNN